MATRARARASDDAAPTRRPVPVSRFRKTTAKTVTKDLRAFADFLDSDNATKEERAEAATWLNDKLDAWLGQDAFGTEGQCDPRGDHRD